MMSCSIPEITAETICDCIEALNKKEGNVKYLSKYIKKSETYVHRAINIGGQLSLFKCEDDDYFLSKSSSSIMKRVNNDAKIVFKEALFNYRPYIQFIEFISNNNDPEEASRKVKAIYDIKNNNKIILSTFKNFSIFLNIELLPEKVNNIFNIKHEYNKINEILSFINNKFQAQMLISEKLGSECYNFINNPERALLSGSFMKSSSDPKNAIDDAAGAFESFIRRIGKEKNIDLTDKNGLGQISQFLASKNNQIILQEHRIMCEFIAAFRNPSSHKVNKYYLEHWEINTDSSIEIILLILTTIRSIYYYAFNKQFIL